VGNIGIGDGLVLHPRGMIGLSDETEVVDAVDVIASEAPRHGWGCSGEVRIYIVLPEFNEARSDGSSVTMTGTPLVEVFEATIGDA